MSALVKNHMRWGEQVWRAKPKQISELDMAAEGFRWQARFELFMEQTQADKGTIHYVFDPDGGRGKTEFVRHTQAKHGWMLATPNDQRTNAYNWKGQRVVIFDVKRRAKLNYELVEEMKDGVLVSAKYEGEEKAYRTPHVIIF